MFSLFVYGTAHAVYLFRSYAILMIDVDEQSQPGSEFDILATVNTTAEAEGDRKPSK